MHFKKGKTMDDQDSNDSGELLAVGFVFGMGTVLTTIMACSLVNPTERMKVLCLAGIFGITTALFVSLSKKALNDTVINKALTWIVWFQVIAFSALTWWFLQE